METEETYAAPTSPNNLVLTPEAQSYLLSAGKWASFLGVLGFVFCALFFIMALFTGTIFSKMAAMAPYNPMFTAMAGFGGFITCFYILIDVLYFFFSLYLYQFATNIKAGISFSDSARVTAALGKLKSFFKLWGIVTIVIIAIYILAFILVIIFAAAFSKGINPM
jgi:hypothetical protein